MTRDPTSRLGSTREDGAEIRSQPFFATIDFQAMMKRQIIPPFRPLASKVSSDDTSNFDTEFTNLAIKSLESSPNTGSDLKFAAEDKFAGFTFVNTDSSKLKM